MSDNDDTGNPITDAADNDDKTLGEIVTNWSPPPTPPRLIMHGKYCRIEPLDVAKHGADLYQANREDEADAIWTYLPYGPFETLTEYQNWLTESCTGDDPMFFAIVNAKTNRATGVASYLRINPTAGSIEVGHINYAPTMQRTPAATEAMYLLMKNVFELGYRRYEWKCNTLNHRSKTAAKRLGFTYEGTFRQMMITKNRNRDSAWFSVIDKEWNAIKTAFETWLADDNFDNDGKQRVSLSSLTVAAVEGHM